MAPRFNTAGLTDGGISKPTTGHEKEPWLTEAGSCPSEIWYSKRHDYSVDEEAFEASKAFRSSLDPIHRIMFECTVAQTLIATTDPLLGDLTEVRKRIGEWHAATKDDLMKFIAQWAGKN